MPALRGGVPVTLVRRRNGHLSGGAGTLLTLIQADVEPLLRDRGGQISESLGILDTITPIRRLC